MLPSLFKDEFQEFYPGKPKTYFLQTYRPLKRGLFLDYSKANKGIFDCQQRKSDKTNPKAEAVVAVRAPEDLELVAGAPSIGSSKKSGHSPVPGIMTLSPIYCDVLRSSGVISGRRAGGPRHPS
jgi:hypothetical protein